MDALWAPSLRVRATNKEYLAQTIVIPDIYKTKVLIILRESQRYCHVPSAYQVCKCGAWIYTDRVAKHPICQRCGKKWRLRLPMRILAPGLILSRAQGGFFFSKAQWGEAGPLQAPADRGSLRARVDRRVCCRRSARGLLGAQKAGRPGSRWVAGSRGAEQSQSR